jgi:outer membrane receptor protein involved in Fe transport
MSHTAFRRSALAGALACALSASVFAQTTTEPSSSTDQQKKSQELEKIVVTGSRIKRVEVEGPTPVVTITGDELKREGFSTVIEALQSMTAAAPNPQPDVLYGSHIPGAKPLNLRYLGPGRSLLLINGQRVSDYPEPFGGQSNFSNYGNIPAAAVDRIEILATGASAIYGSDAVAGVVNIILKKNYNGDQITVRGGGTERGGGASNDESLTGGRTGDNWSLTWVLENFRRKPIMGFDRPFMDDVTDRPKTIWNDSDRAQGPIPGIALALFPDDGNRFVPGGSSTCGAFGRDYEYYHRQSWTRTGLGQGYLSDRGWECATTGTFGYNTLDNGNNNQQGYVYGTYNFTDTLQGYASLAVYETLTEHQTDAPFVVLYPNNNYSWFDPGLADADHPNGRQIDEAIRQFTKGEVGSFHDFRNHTRDKYVDFTAGLKGKVFDDRFDWDVSLRRSQDKTHSSYLQLLPGPVDAFFLGPQLGTTDDGTPIYKLDQSKWNRPLTPQEFASISTHIDNRADAWLDAAQASVTGDIFQGWGAGPIGFAAEAEAARQGYSIDFDPRELAGDFGPNEDLYFNDQGGGSRSRFALGTEFRVPIVSTFTANLGARWDKYNAVNNASNVSYMAGLEYRPIESLLLRGTYATSFRAPDMHYTYARASSSSQRITDYYLCEKAEGNLDNCGIDTPYTHQVNVERQGSTQLDYEKGHSFGYGFVWNATDTLSMSVDYWYIYLKNIIRDIDQQGLIDIQRACAFGPLGGPAPSSSDCAFVNTRIHRDASGVITAIDTGPINQGGQRNAGVDASLKYRIDTASWGNFNLNLDYTLSTKYEVQDHPNAEWRDVRSDNVRSRVRGSVEWQTGPWTTTVLGTRTGGLRSVNWTNCQPLSDGFIPGYGDGAHAANHCVDPLSGLQAQSTYYRGGPAIFWNLGVAYQFNEKLKLSGYVTDVFDKAAVQDPYKLDYTFTWDNLYNQIGRAYSLELSYKFD